MSRIATIAGVALLAATLCGCGDAEPGACARPETPEPTEYRGGSVEGGVYRSAEWNGELLYYPGGAHYKIFHNLGAIPSQASFYLSFERYGLAEGSVAEAAGNQVEIKAIDEESITVVNGTCAEFYLLGVMSTSGAPTSP